MILYDICLILGFLCVDRQYLSKKTQKRQDAMYFQVLDCIKCIRNYHIGAETRWQRFRIQHFQMHFLERKCLNFHWYFTEVYSQGSNWQYTSIGSDNGLVPTRQQAIIWTNDDLVYWGICVTQPQWVKSFSNAVNDLTSLIASPRFH